MCMILALESESLGNSSLYLTALGDERISWNLVGKYWQI